MGMSEEELAGLSDEERAAIADDEDDTEALAKIAGDETGAGSDDDEADDDGKSLDDESEKKGETGDGGVADESGETAGADETPARDEEFHAELRAERPEGLAEKIAALDEQAASLLQQFKDGDIEIADYLAQKDAVDKAKFELTLADAQAGWAEKQNADSNAQRWRWEQERFFAQEKADIYKDPMVLAALNASVKALGEAKENARKPAAFFLEEADRRVRKLFNLGAELKEVKPGGRQPDLSRVPKTLAQLPAAEMAETGDVEFSYLDKLDGMDLEIALRKLTPEQEARYLGAAA